MHAYRHVHVCWVHVSHAVLCFLFAVLRLGHTALKQSQGRFCGSLGL